MDYGENEANRIAEFRRDTLDRRSALMEFDSALTEIDDLLTAEAIGYSLEPLYARLPAAPRVRSSSHMISDINPHSVSSNRSFTVVASIKTMDRASTLSLTMVDDR
jgi:hypothetical protein